MPVSKTLVRVHFARIVKRFKNVTRSKIIPRGSLLSIEDLKELNVFAQSMLRLNTIVYDRSFWDHLTPRQLRKYNKWAHEIAKQNEILYRSILKTIEKRDELRSVEQNVVELE
jgi:hypothetical protein